MNLVRRIRISWKAALASGKIVEISSKIPKRNFESFVDFENCERTEENWKIFCVEEEAYRLSIASKKVEYGKFICKGNYELWIKVIRLLSSIFTRPDGTFKTTQSLGQPWKPQFTKFCKRVLFSLPWQQYPIESQSSDLERIKTQLAYIKKTIQPLLSTKQRYNQESNNAVTKEKLTQLWFQNKQKAIEIIKNNGHWPNTALAVVNKQPTEQYFAIKYDSQRQDLKRILNSYEDSVEVPDFSPHEVENVIRSLPSGKKWGIDGVCYEDYRANIEHEKVNVSSILNTVTNFRRTPRGWKHALIRRIPKKNYIPENLSTLRDISLLPSIYKIFAKCLVKRLLPQLVNSAIGFWQRAYVKERDRQELIFCLKTAIDDFKHISSKFFAVFVDFRDAFGSLSQSYMIQALLESGIAKQYCEIVADIYTDSHFQVICHNQL